MNATPRPRHAFTLVELLVVITIIGILAGLITAAAVNARRAAKRAVIRTEISELEMAIEKYKTEYGEYPPDFFGLQFPDGSNMRSEARRAVLRHLRKRFPRYSLPADETLAWQTFRNAVLNATSYWTTPLDVDSLDSASAIVFWLGGLPADTTSYAPAGFHKDPTAPFKRGLPRTERLFDFAPERYVPLEVNPTDSTGTRYLRFYPAGSSVIGNQSTKQPLRDDQAPYVYFKARRLAAASNRYEYGLPDNSIPADAAIVPACYVHGPSATKNVAVPYLDEYPGPSPHWDDSSNPASSSATDLLDRNYIRRWRNLEKFQIICAGLDGQFGDIAQDPSSGVDNYRFRFSRSGDNFSVDGQDFDNQTNFTDGTLEDEM